MAREFAAFRERQADDFERATLIGYQAVSVYVRTMNKKKMPKFSDLVPKAKMSNATRSPEQARAVLELIAARMGGRVRQRGTA